MPDPVAVCCHFPECNVQATVAYEDTKDGKWFCHGHSWAKDMTDEKVAEHYRLWKESWEQGKFLRLPFGLQLSELRETLKRVEAKLDKLGLGLFGETF